MSNSLDLQYQALLQDILTNGIVKKDRTGTGTISVFGRTIRHKMSDGFPLLTTKKMATKSVITELLWFLRGETNIRQLNQNKCTIWNGDAYKKYCKITSSNSSEHNQWMMDNSDGTLSMYTEKEFIEKIMTDDTFTMVWGDLGPIYGKQWRHWDKHVTLKADELDPISIPEKYKDMYYIPAIRNIDQILNLVEDLKKNPDSRRLMVNAWNVAEISEMTLPPCHYGFQLYTRELNWYDDLDKIKEIYIDWNLTKCFDGYAGDIKADTIKSANQIFVDGWKNNNDPFTGKPLIELECFSSIPKRAISLKFNMRSVDVPLGLPFNIASYAILLEIFAIEANMIADELIASLGDAHIYLNQLDGVTEQISRPNIYNLPKLEIQSINWNHLDSFNDKINSMKTNDFIISNYVCHSKIDFPLSN